MGVGVPSSADRLRVMGAIITRLLIVMLPNWPGVNKLLINGSARSVSVDDGFTPS